MKKIRQLFGIICVALGIALSCSVYAEAGAFYPTLYRNSYNKLLVPTEVVKIKDTYYLVDSYHNQVIYSNGVEVTARDWGIVSLNLNRPHSIAGDGQIFLIVDTDNHRVVNIEKTENGFREVQSFNYIGVRPHYIQYMETDGRYYAWSSMTGEMYVFKRTYVGTQVVLEKIYKIPELFGKYVRSFTIIGEEIFFPCVTDRTIYVADKNNFKLKSFYRVPDEIGGMVQLTKIQNYYYLTTSIDGGIKDSRATIVRAPSLEALTAGEYEDLNGYFGGDGAPYYISAFDGSYYATVIRQKGKSCLSKIDIVDDKIVSVRLIYN